jgi:hypothetical protein
MVLVWCAQKQLAGAWKKCTIHVSDQHLSLGEKPRFQLVFKTETACIKIWALETSSPRFCRNWGTGIQEWKYSASHLCSEHVAGVN